MPNYRRVWHLGHTGFLAVNLLERHGYDRLIWHIDLLPQALRMVKRRHRLRIDCVAYGAMLRDCALRTTC